MKYPEPITIAIADDFPAFVSGLRSIIETSSNHKVIIEAYNGQDLLEKIDAVSTLPDICILDICMPKKNGFDTLAELKKAHTSVKVIMQSMYFDEYNIIKAFRTGASSFLSKKVMADEIFRAIESVYAHGYYYSDWIEQNVLPNLHNEDILTTITDKEKELLTYICSELTYAQIGEKLCKSTRTIESYRDHLFEKLQLKNRTELVIFAIKTGIVPISNY